MKRAFDLFVAIPAVVLLSPVLGILALWVRLDSPGPAFFRQTRVGRFGRAFRVLKFRTMVHGTESLGGPITVAGDPRVTRSGRFLRAYKLDELPQLFNVIGGEMSLVGPRPELPQYVARYPEPLRSKVLSVRPGITDLASVEYRDENEILARSSDPLRTYERDILPRKLAYYERYVDRHNLLLDAGILLRTLVAILR